MSGPDLMNNLLGILLRFRKERVGVMADIQQMFYSFSVREDHRRYLRFLWHRDNDLSKELIEYQMRVHVFGNSPSPAVAAFGLHKTASLSEPTFGADVENFIKRNFYVDDALTSLSTSAQATDLLFRTQVALMTHGNIRLHKFASNSEEVMLSLPHDDLAKDLKGIDLDCDKLPIQRSLGLYWCLESDTFTFQISTDEKPFTRRGVLSVVNSVYDPLGLVAPVTIQGKLILRQLTSGSVDWDEPLPVKCMDEWEMWRKSLMALQFLQIPRMYTPISFRDVMRVELHIFADASEKAIAAVSYFRVTDKDNSSHLGFVIGKAKVAPQHGHTIPRLELCAAVLAVEIYDLVQDNFDTKFDNVKFYTDGRVTLGYICNNTRRFYVYVANRVERIRKKTSPSQWNYIPSHINPADQATRSLKADQMENSLCLSGPVEFLDKCDHNVEVEHNLVNPEDDNEIRPIVSVSVQTSDVHSSKPYALGSITMRFTRFSRWRDLINSISCLKQLIRRLTCNGETSEPKSVQSVKEAEIFVLRAVQRETNPSDIRCIEQQSKLPKDSHIASLNPYLDTDGLLRVGGRLKHSSLSVNEKNPLIIPGKHHIAKLLVRHFHEPVRHQGRHLTEGAIRSSGYWITGGKRLTSSVIHACVICRKERGNLVFQKMADLPPDRLQSTAPFTNVGIDTFGPWSVVTRRTRGGSAESKRWAILFSCLTTRAVHIEIVPEMTSSALINALRRFVAIRGKVSVLRSDRGSNFVGATDDLRIDTINVEDGPTKEYLYNSGTVWIFNSPTPPIWEEPGSV